MTPPHDGRSRVRSPKVSRAVRIGRNEAQCGSGTFEAEPFPQREAPTALSLRTRARSTAASFSAQLAITAPRDVAVIIDFS
jgi:hypothetical protein